MRALPIALVVCLALTSCMADSPATGARPSALNGGAREPGHDGTVLMYWTDGFSAAVCSGTVVAPRVVVSAKHCYFDTGAAGWTANVGQFGEVQSLGVVDVLMTPGAQIENEDIAVVLLGADIAAPAVDIRRDFGGLRAGDGVTLVGYGENPDDGNAGIKYMGDASILAFGPIDEAGVGNNEMLLEGAAACGGDSGGSTLDGNGALMGVIIRGADVACNEATYTVSTRIDAFLDLIDQGIQQSQGCQPTGAEVCNWVDDDCDGQMDEGCASFGQACNDGLPCQPPFVCTPVAGQGDPLCTQVCDPSGPPLETCPLGSYCLAWGCGAEGGHCDLLSGEAMVGAIGAPCGHDEDCANLYCRDPGDGGGARCMLRCEDDAICGAGSTCAPVPQGCGGCAAGDPSLRAFGQACDTDEQCASGLCGADAQGTFCTQACGDCPAGYHCARGECARGEVSDDQGQVCVENDDCSTGLCAHWPEGSSCTSFCSIASPCPAGLTCTDVGDGRSACKPDKTIVGEPCEGNDDCQSALCGHFEDGRGTVCTEPCDVFGGCPAELECVDTSGVQLCAPPPPEKATYGCCSTAGPGHTSVLVGLAGVLVVLLRRRRDHAR